MSGSLRRHHIGAQAHPTLKFNRPGCTASSSTQYTFLFIAVCLLKKYPAMVAGRLRRRRYLTIAFMSRDCNALLR